MWVKNGYTYFKILVMVYILSYQSAFILIHDTWPLAKIVYISPSQRFTASLVRNFNKMCWHQHNLCNSTPTCAVNLHSLGTNQVYNYYQKKRAAARASQRCTATARTHANRRESKSITGPKDRILALELCPARDIKINGSVCCIWQCAPRVDLK